MLELCDNSSQGDKFMNKPINGEIIESLKKRIEELEESDDAAHELFDAVVRMKIDGWLDGEYDLQDQRDVLEAVKEYLKFRYPKQELTNNA